MARETNHVRRGYLAALIGFAAGLVIGLIIAWGVWPVSYKNALPQDLRAAERDQYLAMVASSLAATGDVQAAQERLQTWPTEDLVTATANLQERLLATDPNAAAAVQQLAAALNLGARGFPTCTWRRPALEDTLHVGIVGAADPDRRGRADVLVPQVARRT